MSRAEPGSNSSTVWAIRLGGVLVAVATLALMVLTEPRLAIVWDEGFTLGREERVREWSRAVRDPSSFAATWRPKSPLEELVQPEESRFPPRADEIDDRSELFDQENIEWFWPFAREEPHGHPPFYALVGLLGDVVAPSMEWLARARLGPMVLFSLTAGALFASLGRVRGVWAGLAASGAFVLQPRPFAHGHYARYDDVLTCLWVGSILAFAEAVDRPGGRSGCPGWDVILNRSGALEPADCRLIERIGSKHVLVERRGVPLIWAFPYDELRRSMADAGEGPA